VNTEFIMAAIQPQRGPVLIVEDDEDLWEIVSILLLENGFMGIHAKNGREALLLLEQGLRPGVVLLDLMMPEMSGEELGQRMREGPFSSIPIVVWSGGKQADEAARKMGAVACLCKPVEWSAILDVVQRYVSPN
jgi:CheY-like chemotaxis protein